MSQRHFAKVQELAARAKITATMGTRGDLWHLDWTTSPELHRAGLVLWGVGFGRFHPRQMGAFLAVQEPKMQPFVSALCPMTGLTVILGGSHRCFTPVYAWRLQDWCSPTFFSPPSDLPLH